MLKKKRKEKENKFLNSQLQDCIIRSKPARRSTWDQTLFRHLFAFGTPCTFKQKPKGSNNHKNKQTQKKNNEKEGRPRGRRAAEQSTGTGRGRVVCLYLFCFDLGRYGFMCNKQNGSDSDRYW